MSLKGIDVSYAQKSINWEKVKSQIDFAILRSSFGSDLPSQTDSQFYQNANGCVKYNIPFGIYHFGYFVDEKTAKEEADFAIRLANEYKKYVKFIALDLEEDSENYAHRIGKNPNWGKCAIIFLERIKSAGYTPIVYTNVDWMQNKLGYNNMKPYKIWFAGPGFKTPKYNAVLWQYSWKGKINGIMGDVDMNYLYDNNLIKNQSNATAAISKNTTTNSQMTDREKVLNTAKSFIGKTGKDICYDELHLGMVVDWCAYAISAIMKRCGFIGKYQGNIYGFASDAAREDHGKLGTWFKKGEKTPQPGDYIMFRYASFLNPLDKYSASHVGLVQKVNGDVITTLEGNVDGYGSNWAETSSFKRKTRYLSSSDVYAFYRPNWQGEDKKETPKTDNNEKIDVIYQVHTIGGKWLPNVKNLEDYAGLENKKIDAIKINTSKYHIRYRVRNVGDKKYLPWVTDKEDYAGRYNYAIDRLQIEFYGDNNISNYVAEYRVSTTENSDYLEWVKNYNNVNDDGYAGLNNKCIDKIQIRIVKK